MLQAINVHLILFDACMQVTVETNAEQLLCTSENLHSECGVIVKTCCHCRSRLSEILVTEKSVK